MWIVDAYTTLDNYPYAQRSSLEGLVEDSIDQNTGRLLPPRKEVSYIRNSVKATVDAYDGTVTLYQVDDQDPVLKAWMGVFPDAVTPQDQITDELRSHFRYPEDLFKVQREMLAKYHVTIRVSSSPTTRSGPCPRTRRWRRTPTSRRTTCSSVTRRRQRPRSG